MTNRTAKLFLPALAWPLLTLASAPLQANQNDEAFKDYVNNEICASPGTVDLALTCSLAATTVGGSGSTLPQTGNTGTQGSDDLSARERTDKTQGSTAETRFQLQQWALFSSVDYRNLERDATDLENGFDGDAVVVTAGADFRYSPTLLMGMVLSYGDSDLDFLQESGGMSSERYEGIAFAHYQLQESLYVDGYLGLTQQSNSMTRAVSFGLIQYDASSDYDADSQQWGVGAGYVMPVGSTVVDVALRYDASRLQVDAYEETGGTDIENLNLRYDAQTIDSSTITLSLYSAFNVSLSSGVLVPYVYGDLVREFEDDARRVSSTLVVAPDEEAFVMITDAPDDLYGKAGAGVQLVAPGGLMFFVDGQSLLGHEYLSAWQLSAGFRLEL